MAGMRTKVSVLFCGLKFHDCRFCEIMNKRILFVGNGVTLAHVCRPLQLARGSDPHRYEAHFACDARYRSMLDPLPAIFHAIHTQDPKDFLAALAQGKPLYSSAMLCAEAKEDLALLDQINPDLVVADFRLSMRIATELRHIPYATVTNAHWSPYFSGRYRLPDMPGIWLSSIIGARRFARLAEACLLPMFALHALPMARARRMFGLPSLGLKLQRVYAEADYVLYAEAEGVTALAPEIKNERSKHYFIGPIVWEPRASLPDWWDTIPKDRPIVYVCMGSSGSIDVLPAIMQGLADLPLNIVISTAARMKLERVPNNVYTADYLPGSRIAAMAALVIGNGGSMMLHQCLGAGAPMLAIPSNMDQQMTIAPFVARGAVCELRLASVSPASLRKAVTTMLSSPSYREAGLAVAELLKAHDPTARFAAFLRNIFRSSDKPGTVTPYVMHIGKETLRE
jgi:UDP:flavonoid glycosyltransferase YjiC (YdhE family)